MNDQSYDSGVKAALEAFGVKLAWGPQALMPLAGAAAGAFLAPEGEGMQGAMLGAGAGMMAGHGFSSAKSPLGGGKPPAPGAAPGHAPNAGPPPAPPGGHPQAEPIHNAQEIHPANEVVHEAKATGKLTGPDPAQNKVTPAAGAQPGAAPAVQPGPNMNATGANAPVGTGAWQAPAPVTGASSTQAHPLGAVGPEKPATPATPAAPVGTGAWQTPQAPAPAAPNSNVTKPAAPNAPLPPGAKPPAPMPQQPAPAAQAPGGPTAPPPAPQAPNNPFGTGPASSSPGMPVTPSMIMGQPPAPPPGQLAMGNSPGMMQPQQPIQLTNGTPPQGRQQVPPEIQKMYDHKFASYYAAGYKAAALGFGVNIPGTPFSVSSKSEQMERRPGMTRHVPTQVMDRALTGLYDEGLDPQALMEESAQHGEFSSPAIGALLGAYAAHSKMPGGGMAPKVIGSLMGAAGGSMYHHFKQSPDNQSNMHQALRGVYASPGHRGVIRGQGHESAREPTPLLLSRSGTE